MAHGGAVLEGTVTGYTSELHGVVRAPDGAAVFVPGAVRGERIAYRETGARKGVRRGELVRILEGSPGRQEPDCPWYGVCGGCAARHLTYAEELWAKRQRVRDALARIGGSDVAVDAADAVDVADAVNAAADAAGTERPLRYRNKSQWPVGADGTVGFYRAGSHEVVPVRDCLLLPEAMCRTAGAVREWMRRYRVPAYDERTGKGLIRHVYVRTNGAGESLCCVVANGRSLPREAELTGLVREAAPDTAGVVLDRNRTRGNVVLTGRERTIWGRERLTDRLCGLDVRISVPSFYQVNRDRTEVLYALAREMADLRGDETALDLYCGTGTIGLSMARYAGRVIGAEIVPEAVEDARENAARNGIGNASFLCADASEAAASLAREGVRPDVVVVDPPRRGLDPACVEAVSAMGPRRIVYVSCDPGTLGRDVRRLADAGWCADRASAVDLFPATRHVESVVSFSRPDRPGRSGP